ncbi:hypothetical protein F5887DRAFT_1100155 [Amanita rubescens]|nr:hypothetical protein F5887DRAFT_1100155 [Amanita rubescens]
MYLQQFISEDALHDSMARDPSPRCHPMTREKVFEVIANWINEPNPCQRIMWVNGPAGAGKTAIAQTVAERCSTEHLAASFFFLRNSSDRGSAKRLFTTLAWQLAKNEPDLLPYMESTIEKGPLLPTRSIDIQFDHFIVKLFEQVRLDKPDSCLKKSLVIIDGVDECEPEDTQRLVLELIVDALVKEKIPLRFLICSRAEAHIREAIGGNKMTHTLELDHFAPNNDIRRYLEAEFVRISNERSISSLDSSPWPPNGAIDLLVSKSSGQFIHASTVIKFVDDKDGDPRQQLNTILRLRSASCRSPPFAGLDQLYIQILSQQRDVRFLRDLFALLLALRQPKVSFVCRRLRISNDELKWKLRRMQSLLQISGTVIDMHHLSLQDFLQDKKRAGRFFVHPMRVMFVRLPEVTRPVVLTSAAVVSIVPFAVLTLGVGPLYFLTRVARGCVTSKADSLYAQMLVHSRLI